MRRQLAALALYVAATGVASAHELLPAYLELTQTGNETYDVLFKVPVAAESLRLALYPELPAPCVTGGSPASSVVGYALIERWSVTCPGGLAGATIGITGLRGSGADVLVRLAGSTGRSQVLRLTSDDPSFVVLAEPGLWGISLAYLTLGCSHILLGADHLLFVLGLTFLVSGRLVLLETITAFTLAHSLTLAIATLGYASAPIAPLHASIALSILFLGPEIVRRRRGGTSLTIRHPWIVAFAFGLLHGFGFASGLSTVGVPQSEIPVALLFFNLGVEAGQLGFVALILLLARSFRALEIRWPEVALLLPGYTVGSLGAYWTLQRAWMLFGGTR